MPAEMETLSFKLFNRSFDPFEAYAFAAVAFGIIVMVLLLCCCVYHTYRRMLRRVASERSASSTDGDSSDVPSDILMATLDAPTPLEIGFPFSVEPPPTSQKPRRHKRASRRRSRKIIFPMERIAEEPLLEETELDEATAEDAEDVHEDSQPGGSD